MKLTNIGGMRNVAWNWSTIQSRPHTALYSIHRFPLNEVSRVSLSDSLKSRITVDVIQKKIGFGQQQKINETEPNRNSKNRPKPETN